MNCLFTKPTAAAIFLAVTACVWVQAQTSNSPQKDSTKIFGLPVSKPKNTPAPTGAATATTGAPGSTNAASKGTSKNAHDANQKTPPKASSDNIMKTKHDTVK
jgi:hypothetical protein